MDFSSFKPVQTSNSKKTTETSSNSLEGQREKPLIVAQGFALYHKVYQGCDTCKRETLWYILGDKVTCLSCQGSYNLVSRDKCNLN